MTWAKPLLDKAMANGGLEYSDLALLDVSMTTSNLHERFRNAVAASPKKSHLFRVIFKASKSLFIRLWSLTILESFLAILPQVCMYKILSLLEERDVSEAESVDKTVWFWVAGLGIAKLSYLEINAW